MGGISRVGFRAVPVGSGSLGYLFAKKSVLLTNHRRCRQLSWPSIVHLIERSIAGIRRRLMSPCPFRRSAHQHLRGPVVLTSRVLHPPRITEERLHQRSVQIVVLQHENRLHGSYRTKHGSFDFLGMHEVVDAFPDLTSCCSIQAMSLF